MNQHNYVAILAGGIGSRLWPKSRAAYPKQFLDILHVGKTLIQTTYERYASFIPLENIYIVTAREYFPLVKEQLPGLREENIICEPSRKNTAPCVTYVSFKLVKKDPKANILIAPSDQLIMDQREFERVALQAFDYSSRNNAFVALGIKPLYPNTKYGYIQREAAEIEPNLYKVKTFTEKPPLDMAQAFIASGDFLWNTGIFIWKASDLLRDLQTYESEMYEAFADESDAINSPKEDEAIERVYTLCTNLSIDLAIMEKTENVYIIPCSFGWSDLGTWNSAYDNMEKDYLGNALSGEKIMIVDDSKCLVNVPDDKLVVLQGLEDHLVIDTDDVLLICKKDKETEIKDYLAETRKKYADKFI